MKSIFAALTNLEDGQEGLVQRVEVRPEVRRHPASEELQPH